MQIIRRAIEEPLRQIAQNAGVEGSIVVNKVREGKGDFGYNAATDKYGDLLVDGRHRPGEGRAHGARRTRPASPGLMLTTEASSPSGRRTRRTAGGGGGHAGHGHGDF